MAKFCQFLVFACLLLVAKAVPACVICAPSGEQPTLLARLQAAQGVVLALPQPDGKSVQAQLAIKGKLPSGPLPMGPWVDALSTHKPLAPDDLMLMILQEGSAHWWVLGYLPAARADWLRWVTGQSRLAPGEAGTPQRNNRFAQGLEDAYPLVAHSAYDEIASLPFSALRLLARELDPVRVRRWAQNEQLRARFPLYYLLLGCVGKESDAQLLADRALERDSNRSMPELSAMLAALISIRGEAALGWIEQYFLLEPSLSEPRVQAALMALSVHANEAGTLSKERVVTSYARYIERNPHRCGFVASDLGNWERWEFAAAFAKALRAGKDQVFSSRYSVVFYLIRNPRPEAKALLETLKVEKLL
jgi:hypothetical protein